MTEHEQLVTPPTEIEVAELMLAASKVLTPAGMMILRRLAFQSEPLLAGARAATRSREYEDACWCDNCHNSTPHLVHDSGHERDSSNDWRKCLACNWVKRDHSPEYEPPSE